MNIKLEIVRCPMHGYYAVCINDTRITPDKCCGSWSVFKAWQISAADIRKLLPRAKPKAKKAT